MDIKNTNLVPVKSAFSKSFDEILQTERIVKPVIDIYETDNEFVLNANMPGLSRDNLKVKLEENELVMFGRIDYENTMGRKYLLNESLLGNYFRRFKLADTIDKNKIEAKYDNGQLIVKLPKYEKAKPRTIDIN